MTCGREARYCLCAALASRDAELATLRARLEAAERERDEARGAVSEARALVAEAQSTLDVLRTIADRLAKSSPLDYDGNCVTCGMDEGDDSHAFDCAWAIAAALHGDAPRNWKGEWLDAVRALATKGGA